MESIGSAWRFVRERQSMQKAKDDGAPVERFSAHIPCNGCTACCRNLRVYLEDRESGDGLQYHLIDGKRLLKQTPDGACVHLEGDRCNAYDHRPIGCRTYDCRDMAIAKVYPVRVDIAAAVRRWKPEVRDYEDARVMKQVHEKARNLMRNGLGANDAAHVAITLYERSSP